MAFHPSNSSYTFPQRRGRRSRLTKIYHTTIINQPNFNGVGETLPQIPKLQSSSFRIPSRTSFNLLSRISKFEALDALSLPTKSSSPRPVYPQISQTPSSRNGTEASQTKRLSTIFSPSIESREQKFPSEDFISGRDTLDSTKSKIWLLTSKKTNSRKLQKSQLSNKPSRIKLRGGVWDPAGTSESNVIGVVPTPYGRKEVAKKKIRDMIKFYDGSADTFLSKGSSHLHIMG
jgi:hypothetical protein